MKLSQVIQEMIRLSQAINDYWEAEGPKRHRDYPLMYPGEDPGPPPPEEKQLQELLEGLPDDALYKIALIRELGWGRFGTDNLAAEFQTLKEDYGPRPEAIAVLSGVTAYQLEEGLAALQKAELDVDKLNFKAVRSRK